jgi:hypothetical protein
MQSGSLYLGEFISGDTGAASSASGVFDAADDIGCDEALPVPGGEDIAFFGASAKRGAKDRLLQRGRDISERSLRAASSLSRQRFVKLIVPVPAARPRKSGQTGEVPSL